MRKRRILKHGKILQAKYLTSIGVTFWETEGYAYEISSREIAMEALGLATTSYNFLHKYLDDPSYTKPCNNSSQSPLEILCRIRADKRFDNIFEIEGSDNIETLFQNHEAAVLEYWNAWQISDPTREFEAGQRAAAALLVASHKPGHYDFFIVHLLTTSHAVRILLPIIPRKYHVPLLRQWWLLTIAVYIAQLRPEILLTRITDYDVKGKDWAWADKEATEGKFALDAHYVKAIRAMKEAARDWENDKSFYRKAAVRFATEFEGWGGFGLSTMN
ncbi:MAG: hypothetical protein Q9214_003081 [Letrouitia sp. 1 TL-2023]